MSDLISAAKNGYYKAVITLLSKGCSTESLDPENGATPLYWSSCRGHVEICSSLLKSGCDVNARVRWGSSALHAATDRGHVECVRLLIAWGANVNLQNNRGDTPLHLAAYRGYANIIDHFTAVSANPFLINHSNKTPILEAQCQSHKLASFKLQQYMAAFQGHSSLPSTTSEVSFLTTSMSPTSCPPTYRYDIPMSSNINIQTKDINMVTSDINDHLNDFNNPPSKNQVTVTVSSQPKEASENGEQTCAMKLNNGGPLLNGCPKNKNGNGDSILQMPLHDYHPVLTKKNSAPDENFWKRKNNHNSLSEAAPAGKTPLSRSRSNQEGRVVLENYAESLQLEVVRNSEKAMKLEQNMAVLKHQLCQLETQNRNLLLREEQFSQNLRSTQDLLAKEKRKNFEVAKQQKLLARSVEPLCSETRSSVRKPRYELVHKHVLSILKTMSENGKMSQKESLLELLKQELDTLWLTPFNCSSLDSNHEWISGTDFEIVGDGPLNHMEAGLRNGSCSLVFQIRRNSTPYILKMMINLINLDYSNHDEGCSLDGFLIRNFGPEYHVPLLLSDHPNIVKVVHYYQGSTDHFKKYQSLLIPPNLDVPIEMARRTSFLVLESYPQTLMSFMVKQRTICPEPTYGLPDQFLLLLLYQILSVINHLQCNHIVHRDVKGDNVFLDRYLRPVLADFGFARSLHTPSGGEQAFQDKSQSFAGNSHAWAPELARLHHNGPESLPKLVSLQEVYAKSDGFAVSRMFYSLLRPLGDLDDFPHSSVNEPHYEDSSIPDLPSRFSLGIRDILRQLVLDDPHDRPTARRSMLRVGTLLHAPLPGEVESLQDVTTYLQARAMKLLMIKKPCYNEHKVLNVEESILVVSPEVEASFLVNVAPQEFWEDYTYLKENNLLQV